MAAIPRVPLSQRPDLPNQPSSVKGDRAIEVWVHQHLGHASARPLNSTFDSMKNSNRKPCIILRKNCIYPEIEGRTYPVLSVILLANRRGFLWLSNFFAECAKENPDRKLWKDDPDPDHHKHLDPFFPPFDRKLSDEMEIRVGHLTKKNKKQVYAKYDITSSNPYKRDLKSQYEAQMKVVLPRWKELLRMERDFLKDLPRPIQPARAKRRRG
jgi:hypothetical protein